MFRILADDGITVKTGNLDMVINFIGETPFLDLSNYSVYNEENDVLTTALEMSLLWVAIKS